MISKIFDSSNVEIVFASTIKINIFLSYWVVLIETFTCISDLIYFIKFDKNKDIFDLSENAVINSSFSNLYLFSVFLLISIEQGFLCEQNKWVSKSTRWKIASKLKNYMN